MINGFLFFWLVVFAVIGLVCTVVGGVGLFVVWLEVEREQRQKRLEYESLKQALFNEIEPK